jgi:aspartate kinase
MKLVMKFGGTSIGNGKKIRQVAELVKEYKEKGDDIIVVTSALEGVTDAILHAAHEASGEGNKIKANEFISNITAQHKKALCDAVENDLVDDTIAKLDVLFTDFKNDLNGICSLGELTLRSTDKLSSYGERLVAPILSASLRSVGIESESFTGGEIGILTDDNYGSAYPLESTYKAVKDHISKLSKTSVLVVSGYIGVNKSGAITTLGRGGSDFTASIIGASIKADEIWLWKEVHGIMTTDPKLVPEARPLSIISYIEAMEMSFFGAKVLHPKAIEPAIRHDIPVRVKNTFDPDYPGTLVVKEQETGENVVKAVTVIDNVALINISGAGMVGTIGVAARVFNTLADAKVNIVMISQGSSEANLSIVVDESQQITAVEVLKKEFINGVVGEIESDAHIAVVAVVGADMAGIPGVAGNVFRALGDNNINVIMISQGSSQHNISFVVKKEAATKTVQILHREFSLDILK